MGARKSPQLKKLDEYDKTFRTKMEHPHAFRKNWPKKKARANRKDRAALRSLLASTEAGEITGKLIKHLSKRTHHKTGVVPLREFLSRRWQQKVLERNKQKTI